MKNQPGKIAAQPFRALVRRGMVGLTSLGVFCHVALAEIGLQNGFGPADLRLGTVADFPKDISEGFRVLLEGSRFADPGLAMFAKPSLGALSARETVGRLLDQRMKVPGSLDSLQIPEAFSVVMWVRIRPEQRASILFGFGEPDGDYLVGATDSSGAPSLEFLNEKKVSQLNRAKIAPANLADGRLHAVVAVVNLGSGLVRLYVDGRPEAASTISMWRPRRLGFGFASYSLQGQTSVPGIASVGLLMPRIVLRELTEDEIRKIKPGENGLDPEMAAIDAELGARLAKDTLVEFWPSQYTYMLRWRP